MRKLGTWWAIGGFSALILWAMWRLSAVAVEGLDRPLDWSHWLLLLLNAIFMAYSEGYRGFQLGYSPRLARRVVRIRDAGSALDCALAPLYAMGFYDAPRHRLLVTYLVTAGIIVLIIIFHQLDQPWRGILDAGVVIGLGWGLIATWLHLAQQLSGNRPTTEEYS